MNKVNKVSEMSKVTIGGRVVRYTDWRKRVVALIAASDIPESILAQITEPMARQAWKDNERPEYFLASCVEFFSA